MSFSEFPKGRAKAYCYNASDNTQMVFNEMTRFMNQYMIAYPLGDPFIFTMKTKNGFILYRPVMTAEFTKCIIIIRESDMELAFLVQSDDEIEGDSIPKWVDRAVDAAVRHLQEGASLRRSSIFDSSGMLADRPLVEFTKDVVMPGQK